MSIIGKYMDMVLDINCNFPKIPGFFVIFAVLMRRILDAVVV